jgi:chemotaxis protein methyltransferase CheR
LNRVSESQWAEIRDLVAARLGLQFALERGGDLARGLAAAAEEFGLAPGDCVRSLLSAPLTQTQLEVLASHLTIGETYFFRDTALFSVLEKTVLPRLIQERRGRQQRLRIWTAASCTGEEPYSIAMLLHQLLPDLPDWHVTITATDVNSRFLRKASAGIYRKWSFRNAPPGLTERYFDLTSDGSYAIRAHIKKLVTFSHLNLVEDTYPSLVNETNAMDLIFCRNMLMYFTPKQIEKVVTNLHHALVDGGLLVVAPSEASQTVFRQFMTVNFPGVILYRRDAARAATDAPSLDDIVYVPAPGRRELDRRRARASVAAVKPLALPQQNVCDDASAAAALARDLFDAGRFADAARTLESVQAPPERQPEEFSLLARSLANEGRLAEALDCCERWIDVDKLNPAAHYLRATVLVEHGDSSGARASLRTALFLSPDFVLAHFTLANIARVEGNTAESEKHFDNTLRLLAKSDPESIIPESDGLTAGRLSETIAATAQLAGAA